jgi:polysaccharide biosynthesis transport protein
MESGQWQPDRNGNNSNNSNNSNNNKRQTLWQPQPPVQGDDDVVKLGDIVGTLRRHALLIALTTAGLATLGGFFGRTNPVYMSSFQMLAKSTTVEKQVVGLQPQSLNGQQSGGEAIAGKAVDDTKLRLLFTDKVLQPVVDQLKSKYPTIQSGQLTKGLDIKPVPGTDILEVRYQGNDKVFVQDALNALGQAYVAYSLEEPKADVQQGKDFIAQAHRTGNATANPVAKLPSVKPVLRARIPEQRSFRPARHLPEAANRNPGVAGAGDRSL